MVCAGPWGYRRTDQGRAKANGGTRMAAEKMPTAREPPHEKACTSSPTPTAHSPIAVSVRRDDQLSQTPITHCVARPLCILGGRRTAAQGS